MKSFRHKALLLVLALLAGQWLAVLHAGEHPLLEGASSDGCVVCLQVHSGGAALPGAGFTALAAAPHLAPVAVVQQAPVSSPTRSLSIRGPPVNLA